jgi:hypothetical protein
MPSKDRNETGASSKMRILLTQSLLSGVRNSAQFGFCHSRGIVRWRKRSRKHPGISRDHVAELPSESSPQVGMGGEKPRAVVEGWSRYDHATWLFLLDSAVQLYPRDDFGPLDDFGEPQGCSPRVRARMDGTSTSTAQTQV